VADAVIEAECSVIRYAHALHTPTLHRTRLHVPGSPLAFFTSPSRRWVVICCPSLPCRVHAWAICSCERCRPIKYRHNPQPFRGS
jgi:hypothetical protein